MAEMTKKTAGNLSYYTQLLTLGSTASVNSNWFQFARLNDALAALNVSFRFEFKGTLVGTNIDVNLLGGFKEDGTDAIEIITDMVTALTDTTPAQVMKDLKATPYPFYFIEADSDADETANGLQIDIFGADV